MKKKRGRKPETGEVREKLFVIRFSKREYRKLKALARRCGQRETVWARDVLLREVERG